jgi:hypothetical protein
MTWKGTIFGAVAGFLVTRTVLGAFIGALIGLLYDQSATFSRGPAGASVSEVFFRTTFELMGHVAKSDGRVSEAEIGAARGLMQELNLGPAEVTAAIECFRTGKAPSYDAALGVEQLREACGLRYDLLVAFIELQLRAALAGNGMSPPARERRKPGVRGAPAVGMLRRARDRRERQRSGSDQGISPSDEPPPPRQAGRKRAARIDGAVGQGENAAHPGGLRGSTCSARHALIK